MRAEDIYGPQLDEDFASIRKTMTNYMAGAGLMAAAATGGYHHLNNLGKNPNDPVQFQIDLGKTAKDLGMELEVEVDGEDERADMAADDAEKSTAVADRIKDSDQVIKATRADELLLAKTIWGEARGHGKRGMDAVGHVVVNRALSGRTATFGHGISGVALKRKQFSCWNPGDPNREMLENLPELKKQYSKFKAEYDRLDSVLSRTYSVQTVTLTPTAKATIEQAKARQTQLKGAMLDYLRWEQAKKIAADIISGRSADPTGGALYYHTTEVQPVWSKGLKAIKQIANHVFFKSTL